MSLKSHETEPHARIAFCLMVHDNPAKVRDLVGVLVQAGHDVYVHLDASVVGLKREGYLSMVGGVSGRVNFVPASKCEWGSWKLVEGTLSLVRGVVSSGIEYTHVHLLSGADLPTQSIREFGRFLMRNQEFDYIENVDISDNKWVVHGPEAERFHYYYPFNWRRQRWLFDSFFSLQRLLKIRRTIPHGIRPRLGSQWWTLRMSTCRSLLEFLDHRPDVISYFKLVLIPDECFFQSIVPHVVNSTQIIPRTLTLYKFTPYGKPFVFFDDHMEMLVTEPFFFARKVSPSSKTLERNLLARAADDVAIEWDDADAGHHSLDLLLEAKRAFQFREPMIGHIGNSWRQAPRNPGEPCALLICANETDRQRTVGFLSSDNRVLCLDPQKLPPHWGAGMGSSIPFHSFLVNQINCPGRVTCIVITLRTAASLASELRDVTDIRLIPALVKSNEAVDSLVGVVCHPLSALEDLLFDSGMKYTSSNIPVFAIDDSSGISDWVAGAYTNCIYPRST